MIRHRVRAWLPSWRVCALSLSFGFTFGVSLAENVPIIFLP